MGIFSFISKIFAPAAKIVDELNTSDEERMQLRNVLADTQAQANEKFIELEMAYLEARKEIIKAESSSKHWLQGNWRPICSIALISLIILDSFGIVQASQDLYTLATAFLGIYGAGRSIEKAAPSVKLGK